MTFDMTSGRRGWMGLLARSEPADLARVMTQMQPTDPEVQYLRAPEIGTTMIRGRVGATGAPFNLGEMTVTRCAVILANAAGPRCEGHAYVQGRDKAHARRAAIVDAWMQGPDANETRRLILDPLAQLATERRRQRAGQAAATKVEFFTMVRGE